MVPLNSELLEEIFAVSTASLLVVDASGPDPVVVHANPAFERASGYSLDELKGSSWLGLAAAGDRASALLELRRNLEGNTPAETCLPFLRRNGEIWLGRQQLNPLQSSDKGRKLWLVQHSGDESGLAESAEFLKRALGKATRRLHSLDQTDSVTGLMSRSQFELLFRRELAVAHRASRSLCLMLFSVSELDVYRETFGDNTADSCLRMLAAQIAGTFRRAGDLCARWDATTIAVAVADLTEEQANRFLLEVERKARSLSLHNPRAQYGRYVSVRGALAMADIAGDDVDEMTARVLEALGMQSPEQTAIA